MYPEKSCLMALGILDKSYEVVDEDANLEAKSDMQTPVLSKGPRKRKAGFGGSFYGNECREAHPKAPQDDLFRWCYGKFVIFRRISFNPMQILLTDLRKAFYDVNSSKLSNERHGS